MPSPAFPLPPRRSPIPGIALCMALAGAAMLLERGERALLGRNWVEALVLAILIGAGVRSCWTPGPRWTPGIEHSAKLLLEIAVVLLGASVSAATIAAAGPVLLVAIAMTVATAIGASLLVGRMLGLPPRLALLVACGNAICGNSAIAAVAPVIGAHGDEVAPAIGFTAVLGVGVVLGLPLLGAVLHLDPLRYGALAGLTVYAVPQVLAAAAPFGPSAVQMGTLVKLVRVLMLGPVCIVLARTAAPADASPAAVRRRPGIARLVPWFLVGFLMLMGLRSAGLVPAALLPWLAAAASLLTVVAMAALGLGVDLRTITRAGGRVTATVFVSLGLLTVIGIAVARRAGEG